MSAGSGSLGWMLLGAGFATLMIYRARIEEEKLSEASSEYRRYVKQTGFLFPRWRMKMPVALSFAALSLVSLAGCPDKKPEAEPAKFASWIITENTLAFALGGDQRHLSAASEWVVAALNTDPWEPQFKGNTTAATTMATIPRRSKRACSAGRLTLSARTGWPAF